MKTKRILVVDNEQYIQEVAKVCLETVAGWGGGDSQFWSRGY
jgi:hypothetical protein